MIKRILCLTVLILTVAMQCMAGVIVIGRQASAAAPQIEYVGNKTTPNVSSPSYGISLAMSTLITPTHTGTISKITWTAYADKTGTFYTGLFSSDGTTLLGKSNAVVNVVAGNVDFTFSAPVSVTASTQYRMAISCDVATAYGTNGASPSSGRESYYNGTCNAPLANDAAEAYYPCFWAEVSYTA